jgi:hypothetical protein
MFKANPMRRLIPLCAALVLFTAAVRGQAEEAGTPAPAESRVPAPPIGAALVPEGVFALELAKALQIGQPDSEAAAESLLGDLGIEPENGWIAQYPVTPAVLGEIEKAVAEAADSAKLKLDRNEALRAVADLQARLGLNVSPSADAPAPRPAAPAHTVIYKYTDNRGVVHFTDAYNAIPREFRDRVKIIRQAPPPPPPAQGAADQAPDAVIDEQYERYTAPPGPPPAVIDNYYYVEGPPVVTYYAPPAPYAYLYSWVPYPFWSAGFPFSGFFILHDFHRHTKAWGGHGRWIVSNHLAVPHRPGLVVPVGPVGGGFRGHRNFGAAPPSVQAFNLPKRQPGARNIVTFNRNRFVPNQAVPPSARRIPPAFPSGRTLQHWHNPAPFRGVAPPPRRPSALPGAIGNGPPRFPMVGRQVFHSAPPRTFIRPSPPPGGKFNGQRLGGGGKFNGGGIRGGGIRGGWHR